MSNWRSRIKDIKDQYVGVSGKQVLLVEGPDDIDAFSVLLANRYADWEEQWVMVAAGKKDIVVQILGEEPTWVGVVDRDEWSDEQIVEKSTQVPNLWVLPRFCLECYLISPSELWSALPPLQQSKIDGGKEALREKIIVDIEKWLRHGALWSIVNPMWSGLRALGFKEALLNVQHAQDDDYILTKLQEWHEFLDPMVAMEKFHQQLYLIRQLPEEEQLQCRVHGKMFFEQHVVASLNILLGQKSTDEWRRQLFRSLPAPSDIEPLWQKMGLH